MAERKYEIDDQGNLVQSGEAVVEGGGETSSEGGASAPDGAGGAADRPVTEADRRRFLNALLASDVLGVLVLAGGGLLLPESRAILLIFAAVYAVAGVAIYIWMSRTTQQKVEASRRRQTTI